MPLVSCVWSSGSATAMDYPARYLFAFLRNHGMLSVTGSPQWYTVTGGSHEYVRRVAARLEDVRLSCPVTRISRSDPDADGGVTITDGHGKSHRFDSVVVAVHPDQALAMLADPTPEEKSILSAFRYSAERGRAAHTDSASCRGLHVPVRRGTTWSHGTSTPPTSRRWSPTG